MSRSKELLNKMPRVKKALKYTLGGVLSMQEQRRVAKYNKWIKQFDLSPSELQKQAVEALRLKYRPFLSIVAPTYNTPERFFRDMVESVLGQTYDNWELILVDDASPDAHVRELIEEYASKDTRVKQLFLKKNHHISGATNEAIKIAKGEFISLFDHDDILRPNALFEIAKSLNENKKLDFIYTDEDKIIDSLDSRRDPFFKPDWNPDFLYSVNYITHFTTIRKTTLDKLGYEDGAYNGAQDWELFLRITRGILADHIHHIPKILYNWRIHDASTAKSFAAKPYVVESQKKSIESDLQAKKYTNAHAEQDTTHPGQWQVKFTLNNDAKVLVVVSNSRVAEQVKASTHYSNFDVMVRSGEVAAMDADFIAYIEEDSFAGDENWLSEMIPDAARKDIGCVIAYGKSGSYRNNLHTLLTEQVLEYAMTLSKKDLSRHLYETTRYNIPYATGGIAVVEAEKIKSIQKHVPVTIEEISKQLAATGYRNLYNPYVKMVK